MPKNDYFCSACAYYTTNFKDFKNHLVCNKHLEYTGKQKPKLLICDECSKYKSYSMVNFNKHKKYNHNKNDKKIIFDEDEIIIYKNPVKYKIKDLLTQIKLMLNKYKSNRQNPNKYFNFGYYILNFNKKDGILLHDFLEELQDHYIEPEVLKIPEVNDGFKVEDDKQNVLL